jgi:hypothetical protein
MKMEFLVMLETAPLALLESDQLPAAAEALLDQLGATNWAHDPVTSFDQELKTLGARFLVEAENIANVAYSSNLVFGFLHCVMRATIHTLGGIEQLPNGAVVGAGSEMLIEPGPDLLTKIEVERAPVAA